jgi:hypothetical protein
MKTNRPSLKGSLSNELGTIKKVERQSIDIPVIKENVTELHKKAEASIEIEIKKILVKVDKDLHKKIKTYCVDKEMDLQEYFNDAIYHKAKIDKLI